MYRRHAACIHLKHKQGLNGERIMAEDNPWLTLLEADSMWDWDETYPYTATWPTGHFCQHLQHLYIPYYRQQRDGQRWADMTYANDADNRRRRIGKQWADLTQNQDDPEWDKLSVTDIVGMDGHLYGIQEYRAYYNVQLCLGESPSSLRQLGHTHDPSHQDARGPALSHHFCRPAYRLPSPHRSGIVGARLFRINGDDIRAVLRGLLERTFLWPHMGAINVTYGDKFPWRDLFRIHPFGRALVGAGLLRILVCADPEHEYPYFILHRKVLDRHATLGNTLAMDRPCPPDLLVQYPYMLPEAAQGIECMRMDLYHDARVVCAHWRDFYPPSRTDIFPYLDVIR